MNIIGDLLVLLKLKDELTPEANRVADQVLPDLENAVNQVSGTLAENEKAQKEWQKAAKESAYQFTLLGRGLVEAGVLMTGAFTVPLLAAADAVVKFGSKFETEMTKVVTLGGATAGELEYLKQKTLDLAPAVGVGPEKLAGGLYVLTSYGYDAAKSMDVLRVSAEMSALGMGTTEQTALALTGAMFAYKNQNLQASEAANILMKAVKYGNMEIQQLVPAISRVNPVAASMGINFKDVATAIAVFTRSGADAAMAATSVRAMLSNILTDSAKTEKGFRELAAAANDNTISMSNFVKQIKQEGLSQAMLDLMEKTEKAGDKASDILNKIFPNVRALTGVLATYKINGGDVVEVLRQMNDKQDILRESTELLHQTFAFKFEQMKIAVENLWIRLGNSLLPVFSGMIKIFSSFVPVLEGVVNGFNALPTSIQAIIFGFGGLLAVAGPLAIIIGQLFLAFGNLERALISMKVLTEGSGLITLFSNPYLLAAAAVITAIGAAFYYFGSAASSASEEVHSHSEALQTEIQNLEKLKNELSSNSLKGEELEKVKRTLIASSNDYSAALVQEKVSQQDVIEVINKRLLADKQLLAANINSERDRILRMQDEQRALEDHIKQVKAWIIEQDKLVSAQPGRIGIAQSRDNNLDTLRKEQEQYDKLTAAINQHQDALDAMKRAADPALQKAYEMSQEVERQATRTKFLGDQTKTLAERVASLTEQEKLGINALVQKGYTAQRMSQERIAGVLIETSVIDTYLKQLKIQEKGARDLSKEEDKQKEIREARLRVEGTLLDMFGSQITSIDLSKEEWAKLGIQANATLDDIHHGTGINVNQLILWRREIKEASQFEQERAEDTKKAYAEIEQALGRASAFTLAAEQKTAEAQKAIIESVTRKKIQDLSKLNISWQSYWTGVVAYSYEAAQQMNAIDTAQYVRDAAFVQRLMDNVSAKAAERIALEEQTESIINEIHKDALAARLSAIESNRAKAIGEIEKWADQESRKISNQYRGFAILEALYTNVVRGETANRIKTINAYFDALIEKEKEARRGLEGIVKGLELANSSLNFLGSISGKAFSEMIRGVVDANNKISSLISNFKKWQTEIKAAKLDTQNTVVASAAGFTALSVIVSKYVGLLNETKQQQQASREAWQKFLKESAEYEAAQLEKAKGLVNDYADAWKHLTESGKVQFMTDALFKMRTEAALLRSAGLDNEGVIRKQASAYEEFLNHILDANIALEDTPDFLSETLPVLEQMAELGLVSERTMRRLMGLPISDAFDWKGAEEAAKKYGIEVDQILGKDFLQSKMAETMEDVAKDWKLLEKAGVPLSVLIDKIGPSIQKAVIEAKKFGLSLPASMKPMVQAMIDSGELVDENGQKLTDLSQLNFSQPIEDSLKELIQLFKDWLKAIRDAATEIGKFPKIPVPDTPDPKAPGAPGGSGDGTGSSAAAYWSGLPTGAPSSPENAPVSVVAGGNTFVIQAVDAKSFEDMLRRGGARTIAKVLPGALADLGVG